MTKKIKISESDLYNIIKQVLIEQEQKEVWITDEDEFISRLFDVFDGNSEKFAKVHNKHYDKIVVNGPLKLDDTKIEILPDNLTIHGNLDLRETHIEELPNNLNIDGYLNLRSTPIKKISDIFTFKSNLNLGYCRNLTTLPDTLEVWGRMDLYRSSIKTLPNNLDVGRSLILIETEINVLPDNLKVGCCIYIHNTPLSKNNELIKKYADEGHIIITEPVTYSEIIQDEKEIDEYKKFEFELGEQSTEGDKPSYPAVTKWDSGVKRGPANSINPKQKWSETYPIKRGKANTIDQKNKWSTDLTRGKANTLL